MYLCIWYRIVKLRIRKTIESTEAIHQITFDENMDPIIPPRRNQGRPKYKWAERAIIEYWNEVRKTISDMTATEYDPNNEYIRNYIKEYASV